MFHPRGPTLVELARQALSSTDAGYDLLAPKFEHTPFRTPDSVLDATAVHFGAPRRALDVCTGTGAAARTLLAHTREHVVGVDRSVGMLEQARRTITAPQGGPSVSFVRGDTLALPFDAGTFDLVTCFGAFGHIEAPDEPAFVHELNRVLRPEGRFVFATVRRPPAWSRRALAARAFNAVMRVRNALWDPPFIMYYLTFMLPDVQVLLEESGFSVDVKGPLGAPPPFDGLCAVVATRER